MTRKNLGRLLLINPWIYDFAAYDFWAKPLGFLYLASLLRNNGYEVDYIDCLEPGQTGIKAADGADAPPRKEDGRRKFCKEKAPKPLPLKSISRNYSRYGISRKAFFDRLNGASPPKAILVTSAMTYWYPGVFEAIKLAKAAFPHIPIILGGIYATLCYAHAKERSGADFVLSGMGGSKLLPLISALTGQGSLLPGYQENFDSLPYPAFDLYHSLHYVCLLTSRGCLQRCHYCASHLLADSYCSREPMAVADEIEFWKEKRGIRNFAFYDDALLVQPEQHIVPLLQEIIRRRLRCDFHTPNGMHIRAMSEELAHLMFQAGFKTIRFGLETSNEAEMEKIGAKTTRKEFVAAVNSLQMAGYAEDAIGVYLLAGLPGQKAQAVEESIRFVKDCGARPYVAEYSPIPGTRFWEEALASSRYDLAREPLFHNNSIFPCEWEEFTHTDLDRLKQLLR